MFWVILALIGGTFIYQYFTKEITEDGCGKTVSRKSWSYKLIKWTLKNDPQFRGYCPYFWAGWLCVFLLPVTCVVKIFEVVLDSFQSDKHTKPQKDEFNAPSIATLYSKSIGEVPEWYYREWFQAYPNWREEWKDRLELYAKQMELYAKQKQAIQQKEERRAQLAAFWETKLEFISKYASYLIKPSLVALAAGLVYLLYLALGNLIQVVKLSQVLWAGGIVAVLFAIAWAAQKGYTWLKVASRVVQKVDVPKPPPSTSIFWPKVCAVLLFIPRLVLKSYQKECPIITYED